MRDWEDEFEKRFPLLQVEGKIKILLTPVNWEDLRQFIRSLLSEARKEEREKMIELINQMQNPYPEDIFLPVSAEWLHEVHEFYKSKGGSLDVLSGHMGRIVFKAICAELEAKIKELSKE